jgi:DNA (cytosine-5)-methyltransferase 1
VIAREPGVPHPGEVELIAGGPPCQGFSGYNRFRSPRDPRNSLLDVFLDFVLILQPQYVLIENVPGMLSMDSGKVVRGLLASMQEIGYDTRLGILQAGHYGLPQNRWRVFIWGAKHGLPPEFPEPTHQFPRTTIFGGKEFRSAVIKPLVTGASLFGSLLPTVTVGDAIRDLPVIPNGGGEDQADYQAGSSSEYQQCLRGTQSVLFDHRTICLGKVQLQRCQAVPKLPGAGWLDLPQHLKPKNLLRHGDKRYDNRFGRLHWAGTFNTILSAAHPYWGAVFHPEQDRVISVRESARAQGFPDSVRFMGPMTARYEQVGNAVPPPLAAAIATAFLRQTLSEAG